MYGANGKLNTDPRTRLLHAVAVADVSGSSTAPAPLILLRTNESYVHTLRGASDGIWSEHLDGHRLRALLSSDPSGPAGRRYT
jgi:hypothetical protein